MRTFNVENIAEGIYLLKDAVPEITLNGVVWYALKGHFLNNVKLQSTYKTQSIYDNDDHFYLYGVKVVRYVKPLDRAFEEIEKWRR